MESHRRVEVTSAGKVLITGGYLIIDPTNCGLVLATSTHFCCRIENKGSHDSTVIECPQLGLKLVYDENTESNNNDFLDKCMTFVKERLIPQIKGIKITLLGDNEFYS